MTDVGSRTSCCYATAVTHSWHFNMLIVSLKYTQGITIWLSNVIELPRVLTSRLSRPTSCYCRQNRRRPLRASTSRCCCQAVGRMWHNKWQAPTVPMDVNQGHLSAVAAAAAAAHTSAPAFAWRSLIHLDCFEHSMYYVPCIARMVFLPGG